MSLFAELHRRNVLRVAVGYAVLSWVVLQIMDVLAPALLLPDWTITMVAVLLVLGAIPTLIFSWVYELTPDGLKKESEIPAGESITAHTAQKLDIAVIVLLISAIAIALLRPNAAPTPTAVEPTAAIEPEVAVTDPEATGSTIVVLPFADLSPDSDQGYFADGISEEILNLLAQHADLRVVARTSAFQFREAVDLREVGTALNANRSLEGSVRTDGIRVRITAQLIDAETGLHIWSDSYDRELTDIFAVQDEIAAAIMEALGVHLGVGEEMEAGAEAARTGRDAIPIATDLDAYRLYLQGRKALSERSQPGRLADAIDLLEQAIAADTSLAVAHGSLALAHALSPFYTTTTNREASRLALPSADRALALDPDSVEALVARGYSLALNEYRIAEGEADLQRAIELRPNDLMAANLNGDLYRLIRDRDRALYYDELAAELDPLDPVQQADLAWTHNMFGEYEEGLIAARRGLALEPRAFFAATAEVWSLILTGELDVAEARVAQQVASGNYPPAQASGDRLMMEDSRTTNLPPTYAVTLAYLYGDRDETVRLLRQAIEQQDLAWAGEPWGLAAYAQLLAADNASTLPQELEELLARQRQGAAWDIDLRTELLALRGR